MLEKKLTDLEIRLEGLAEKLEFAQEEVFVQVQAVKDELLRTRVFMDAIVSVR